MRRHQAQVKSRTPVSARRVPDARLGTMPVLEPNPPNGQKKLLALLGVIAAIVVVVSIIASVAQSMG
ncbi:hypothetical protein GCM10010430_14620 [Kitasatospora cystarginea]|uniref:Uncharacterized protein n=1 Tax=Kitasatospora cystarginea TaxID=58350 RepID=A0ABN3DKW8_9ACTN